MPLSETMSLSREATGGVNHVNEDCIPSSRPVEYSQSEPSSLPWYAMGKDMEEPEVQGYDGTDESLYSGDKSTSKMLFTPALVGMYAVAGLYIGRVLTGSVGAIPLSTVAMVGASSAASAAVAPTLSSFLVCPNSATAPLVEAAISTAISYELIMLASSSEDAVRFIPVQLVSYVGGVLMAPKVKEWIQKQRQGSG